VSTVEQACIQADLLAFFASDDRDLTDPINEPAVADCETDEPDPSYPPFGGTR
jgi:hypothetical protein